MATINWTNDPVNSGTYIIYDSSRFRTSSRPTHTGVDFSTYYADPWQPVFAVADGTVVEVVNNQGAATSNPDGSQGGTGYGNYIVIDHGNGVRTKYAHLYYSSAKVEVGDTIEGGTQIANVGSTGNSTGAHLHFEVIVDGSFVDPSDYLGNTGSTDILGNAVDYNTTGEQQNSSAPVIQDTPYTSLSIVGKRISELSPQPMHAYVKIFIGDKLLSSKPNILQSFEITRYRGAGETATFTLFDDTWVEIEKDFANNWKNVKIEYGYVDSDLVSARYNMQLLEYSLSFSNTGVFITCKAISVGAVQNLGKTTILTNTTNPTEALSIIANTLGWKGVENFVITDPLPSTSTPFNIIDDYPITYINDTIVPLARSTETGEIVEFLLDDSTNTAYFQEYIFINRRNIDPNREIKTYIFQKGYDSPIRDLTFDIKGVFGGTSGFEVAEGLASGLKSSVFDIYTKEEVSGKEDLATVVTAATGTTSFMDPAQSVPSMNSSGYDPVQMKNKLYYSVKKSQTSQYEANMTIIGDPTIVLLEDIRIINVTDDGFLHHTSGIYMISGIVDNISGGVMTTTLKLIRNGTGYINEGVEILNPKILVK